MSSQLKFGGKTGSGGLCGGKGDGSGFWALGGGGSGVRSMDRRRLKLYEIINATASFSGTTLPVSFTTFPSPLSLDNVCIHANSILPFTMLASLF